MNASAAWGSPARAAKYFFARRGILAMTPTLVYCFWHSGESAETSDLQLTFTPASYLDGVKGKLEAEPGMTVPSWQQRPESRGWLRLRSADPFDPPLIQTNYLAEEIDRRVFIAGMKLARTLLKSRPLAPYYDHETYPGSQVQTDDEFLDAGTRRGQTTFHPGCTCRMGPAHDRLAVVDDQLRVHGMEGLRVVDASGHAEDDLGEPQRLHPDDRREGGGLDTRRGAVGRYGPPDAAGGGVIFI